MVLEFDVGNKPLPKREEFRGGGVRAVLAENGEPINAAKLNAIYAELLRTYYGPDYTIDENGSWQQKSVWMRETKEEIAPDAQVP